MTATAVENRSERTIRTNIPARLDRLPWARFHWLIIVGLGTAWILDGLEVTIVGSVASRMTSSGSGIHITAAQIGIAAAIYVAGDCTGALVFGQLTDRFGRKKLFMITLALYICATAATGASFNYFFFYAMRFLTGAGIGGEYAAINSAIDELIPARARGRVDLGINGSYWIGSALGSAASLAFLNTAWFPKDIGWRAAFGLGVILALSVMLVRRHVPESPRWLFIHGYEEQAEALVDRIESDVQDQTEYRLDTPDTYLTVRQRQRIPFRLIARTAFTQYRHRAILALALFVGQAFIYNGITFNLGTLMHKFYGVSSSFVPVFVILYALGNFAGPVTIGRLFDTVGRKRMITGTYIGSAVLGLVLAGLFVQAGALNAWTFIVIVIATFFLASAGASAAYLTASEIFPMETRALAIAFFFAIGTAVGGTAGPLLFGSLIGSGDRGLVGVAFLIGSLVMALGGIAEIFYGVAAECQPLESIARPLTATEEETPGDAGGETEGRRRWNLMASEERRRAAEERADAATHRAQAHVLRARMIESDGTAGDVAPPEDEETLADIADLMAAAHDELAVAADERGAAEQAVGDPKAARAAEMRAEAAEHRASAHEERSRALSADEAGERRRGELAAAAWERSRAAEQRAFAEAPASPEDEEEDTTEPDVLEARRRMHLAWAEVHDHRARLHEAGAAGDEASRLRAEREGRIAEERALAQGLMVEAARRRSEADSGRQRPDQTAQEQEAAEAREEREMRIRRRLERRSQRARGVRRYMPGPGRYMSSAPSILSPSPYREEALDSQVAMISQALREHGPTTRDELSRMLGARYWGPGVFGQAVQQAVDDGEVKRVARGTYALSETARERQARE